MERPATGSRIATLSSALAPPARPGGPASPMVPEPDPQALIAQERSRVLEAARKDGHARGMAEAEEAVRVASAKAEEQVRQSHAEEGRRLAESNQGVKQLLRSLEDALTGHDERLEALSIEIAFVTVARLLGSADRTLLTDLCRQALDEYKQRPVILRVSSGDIPLVESLADGENVRLLGDPHLARGQCRLETHKGLYETGLEARLDAVKTALLKALAAGDAGV